MKKFNLRGIFKGILFSCVTTFISLFLITFLTYFTDIELKIIDLIVFVCFGIGIFLGSLFVSKGAEEKKFFHGLSVGIGSLIIFAVFSFFVNGGIVFNSHFISIIILCLFTGSLGGILGK